MRNVGKAIKAAKWAMCGSMSIALALQGVPAVALAEEAAADDAAVLTQEQVTDDQEGTTTEDVTTDDQAPITQEQTTQDPTTDDTITVESTEGDEVEVTNEQGETGLTTQSDEGQAPAQDEGTPEAVNPDDPEALSCELGEEGISTAANSQGGLEFYATYAGYRLRPGIDYTYKAKGNFNSKKRTIKVKFIVTYKGIYRRITKQKTFTMKVTRYDSALDVTPYVGNVSAQKVKKRAVRIGKPMRVSNYQGGKLTYKRVGGSKRFTVNSKNGKVTTKKRTKAGTYKVKIRVTSAGTWNRMKGSRTVTCYMNVN